MSRRTWTAVHSAICVSSKMQALPDDSCRLFFHQLIQACDSYGCIDARPHRLVADVWPVLGKTIEETARCASELERVGLIVRRVCAGEGWFEIPDWDKKAGALMRRRGKRTFGLDATPVEPPAAASATNPPPDYSRTTPGPLPDSPLTLTLPSVSGSGGGRGGGIKPKPKETQADVWSDALALHPGLDTAEVRQALASFAAYRIERGLSRLQARSWVAKAAEFEPLGPDALVAALEASIGNGWQGVFPPAGQRRPAAPAADSGRALVMGTRKPEPRTIDVEASR